MSSNLTLAWIKRPALIRHQHGHTPAIEQFLWSESIYSPGIPKIKRPRIYCTQLEQLQSLQFSIVILFRERRLVGGYWMYKRCMLAQLPCYTQREWSETWRLSTSHGCQKWSCVRYARSVHYGIPVARVRFRSYKAFTCLHFSSFLWVYVFLLYFIKPLCRSSILVAYCKTLLSIEWLKI